VQLTGFTLWGHFRAVYRRNRLAGILYPNGRNRTDGKSPWNGIQGGIIL
jgi:hypothetical protein